MQYGGEDHQQLDRMLAGIARHPNIGGYVLIGLGCETATIGLPASTTRSWCRSAARNGSGSRSRPPVLEHAGRRRHAARRSRPACRLVAEMLPRVNDVAARADSGQRDRSSAPTAAAPTATAASPPTRPSASPATCSSPAAARHPRRDDRDLRRRATAHAPRRHAGGRREAGRTHQVVGMVHRHVRRADRQQSLARQQGRRPDHDLRKVARRDRQGRQHGA